jgi:pyridoxamine 5'-phosphate oxidase
MSIMKSLNSLRRDYTGEKFDEKTIDKDPTKQFKKWLDDAVRAEMMDPNAMVLSTCGKDMKPTGRIVLLKNFDERGYVFFSNYESIKGQDINENPNASLLFYWDRLDRQIRIEGRIEKISSEESDEYFQTRDYTSRIGAWASKQSSILTGRISLLRKVAVNMAKYPKHVPLPPYWGGYRVVPERIEFWQGRESRLHDRLVFVRSNDSWEIIRLNP